MSGMSFKLLPSLADVDWETWERHFPNGIGASVFSSPGWQRLMRPLVPGYTLKFLVCESGSRRFSLPIHVKRWRYGRVELTTHPTAYGVLPIESPSADASSVDAVIAAARSPFVLRFRWWLPPWTAGDRSRLTDDVNTYVIELDRDVEEYLRTRVRRRFLEQVRTSYRRGIEVIEHPSDAELADYVRLYHRAFDERKWEGDRFPLEFFQGVRSTLGDAGRVLVFKHEGKVVAGGVVLFDRHAAHYFQGALDRDNVAVKPHLVMYDWLLRAAAARGLRYVNLGGINDGNQSLVDFKLNWGAVPRPLPQVEWVLSREAVARRLGLEGIARWAEGSVSPGAPPGQGY